MRPLHRSLCIHCIFLCMCIRCISFAILVEALKLFGFRTSTVLCFFQLLQLDPMFRRKSRDGARDLHCDKNRTVVPMSVDATKFLIEVLAVIAALNLALTGAHQSSGSAVSYAGLDFERAMYASSKFRKFAIDVMEQQDESFNFTAVFGEESLDTKDFILNAWLDEYIEGVGLSAQGHWPRSDQRKFATIHHIRPSFPFEKMYWWFLGHSDVTRNIDDPANVFMMWTNTAMSLQVFGLIAALLLLFSLSLTELAAPSSEDFVREWLKMWWPMVALCALLTQVGLCFFLVASITTANNNIMT